MNFKLVFRSKQKGLSRFKFEERNVYINASIRAYYRTSFQKLCNLAAEDVGEPEGYVQYDS